MQGLLRAMGALIWASVALLLAAGIAVRNERGTIDEASKTSRPRCAGCG